MRKVFLLNVVLEPLHTHNKTTFGNCHTAPSSHVLVVSKYSRLGSWIDPVAALDSTCDHMLEIAAFLFLRQLSRYPRKAHNFALQGPHQHRVLWQKPGWRVCSRWALWIHTAECYKVIATFLVNRIAAICSLVHFGTPTFGSLLYTFRCPCSQPMLNQSHTCISALNVILTVVTVLSVVGIASTHWVK